MYSKSTDRKAPGVGGASLQFEADKFHKDMLRGVKSRVGRQFNDLAWLKHRKDLTHFKREHGVQDLRQIDKKNLQMFIRLSAVQPSVPVVVKRNIVQQVELQPIPDASVNDEQDSDKVLVGGSPLKKNN